MSEYAVITENDESPWEDVKGEVYHYPNTYKEILTPGCKVIYYKGKMTDRQYVGSRLSPDPHYFGIATIGQSVSDPLSNKKDFFCEILEFSEFTSAVPFKIDDQYLEDIPDSRRSNYWRFGVRELDKSIYDRIVNLANTKLPINRKIRLPSISGEFESTRKEGKKKLRYTTYYERNPINRQRAIEIHGLDCMACGFNFEAKYGDFGAGYIHVHHVKPVSELDKETTIDPATDLVVLCPNCHAMIHKNKEKTLSLEELKEIISAARGAI